MTEIDAETALIGTEILLKSDSYKNRLLEFIGHGKSRSEIYVKFRYMKKERRAYIMGLLKDLVDDGQVKIKIVRRVQSEFSGGRPCALYYRRRLKPTH
jgi:hypothetical protein